MTDKYIFHLIIKIREKIFSIPTLHSQLKTFFYCFGGYLSLAFTMIIIEKKTSISLHYYLLIISE